MFVRNFYLCVKDFVMKSIVIYPDSPKQFSVIETFLEKMKIRFKSQEDIIISEEIKQSVSLSLLRGLLLARCNLLPRKEGCAC